MSTEVEEKNNSRSSHSIIPIIISLALLMGSVVYIAFRTMSNKAYEEKWKDYDECGLG